MFTYPARVTVRPADHSCMLTDPAHVVIATPDGDVTAQVPDRCHHGFALFWHRVHDAVTAVGYRFAPGSGGPGGFTVDGGWAYFTVVPKLED